MRQLNEEGRRVLDDIARRYGVSPAAVEHLLAAVMAGYGSQAQFNHPELGGMGQWSAGGMIMIGDMFNNGLKATVDGICRELAGLLGNEAMLAAPAAFQSQQQGGGVSLFVPGGAGSGNWWSGDLGVPASTGGQNNLRYAFFPATRRLAIDIGGRIRVFDTKDHRIGGFSQQQGGDQSLTFTSQYGLVSLSELEEVPVAGEEGRGEAPAASEAAVPPAPAQPAPVTQVSAGEAPADDDIFGKIERLAALHAKGILTEAEFQAKKAELLDRL
ncbi:SHOCT domain-containing protein [Rhizobiaceae bacterium BDR2-2]|uniref:SHOCT domain-containing protein n=1 Tax=Ectorhizobium quercum TaxID=2965071 RepID=A0AAE3N136_9HYPH|nr:SHOCT domain-containing protein [Ectorhizobium quercum]MCX8998007.1 SHOCT domain-containing protein [Ectorhizobium quercum]